MIHRRIAVLCVLLALVACGGPPPSPTVPPTPTPGCVPAEAAAFLDEIDGLLDEWDDMVDLAGSTGRISLAPVIEKLQAIRRRVRDLDTPCTEAATLTEALADYMDATVQAYLAFMAQRDEDEVDALFTRASDKMKVAGDALLTVKAYTQ